MKIHPTAVVAEGAKLSPDVTLGPFCVVGAEVELGAGVELISHVVVGGRTKIGAGTRIFPFASIGLEPQDKKYHGEASELIIGSNNTIRENVTMNPGTAGGGMITRVGDRGLFMTGAHVAHDCRVGDDVIMANNATLAGHVELGDFSFLGGLSAVHQFCRIGRHAFVGGLTGVERDVIPFGMVIGDRARLVGLNLRGLQRHGFTKDEIHSLRAAYDVLFARDGTLASRLENVIARFGETGAVGELMSFLHSDSSRAICQPDLEHGTP